MPVITVHILYMPHIYWQQFLRLLGKETKKRDSSSEMRNSKLCRMMEKHNRILKKGNSNCAS